MRYRTLLSAVRPLVPVLLGLSLGFTLSLLGLTWMEETCGPRGPAGRHGEEMSGHGGGGPTDNLGQDSAGGGGGGGGSSSVRRPNSIVGNVEGEDYQPRIVPYTRPADQPRKAKMIRPRYISTELGLRERLLVGVLTSRLTLPTLAVAVNRTAGHHLPRTLFFTGQRSPSRGPQGMNVVTHGDERPVWNMYHTLRYVHDHHGADYDWFFFAQDDSYMQAERVKELVGHLSIDAKVYLGHPEEFIMNVGDVDGAMGGGSQGHYCHGGYGFVLSRKALLDLNPHLESCRDDILSSRADEWLGRCLIDTLHLSCSNKQQEQRYRTFELGKNVDPEREEGPEFENAYTVWPVTEPVLMYRLHKRFTEIELERTYHEIKLLQAEIKNVSVDTPEGEKGATWPLGVNAPYQPRSRFEVLSWEHFNEEYSFSCIDGSPKCSLGGADRMDATDIVETAVEQLNARYGPILRFRKLALVNGYRRFDPTRGMEYTLDLSLEVSTQRGNSRTLVKRVHLVRPLGTVEIIPMPYVTEATRVHVVLPLTVHEREHVSGFLASYANQVLETHENAVLTLLFVYDPFDAQKVNEDDIFAGVKAEVGDYERRYPEVKFPWISVKTDVPSQLKLIDILSKKHPVDTLFLVASVGSQLTIDFLNRCRMNAIAGWQVFFPIHFQEYDPQLVYRDPERQPTTSQDISRETGHFDRAAFDEACFYNSDYMAARSRMVAEGPPAQDPMAQDASEDDDDDLYGLFVRHSSLHVFRGAEPALRHTHLRRACNPRLSEGVYHRCHQSDLESLASRSQLASLLFQQEQSNST
ncbi:unnamed protein product [Lampetra planeri]